MSSLTAQTRTGKFVGTAAAKKIVLGFKPKAVKLVNEGGLVTGFKSETMDADKAEKRITAGDMTFPANMVTINSDGFTIGSDADLNGAGELIHYVAWESKADC